MAALTIRGARVEHALHFELLTFDLQRTIRVTAR
jgi:hypothetical protein